MYRFLIIAFFFYIVLNNVKEIQVIVLAFSCFGIHFLSSRKKHFFYGGPGGRVVKALKRSPSHRCGFEPSSGHM